MKNTTISPREITGPARLTSALPVISLLNPLVGLIVGYLFLQRSTTQEESTSARATMAVGGAILGVRLAGFVMLGGFIGFIVLIGVVVFAFASLRYS